MATAVAFWRRMEIIYLTNRTLRGVASNNQLIREGLLVTVWNVVVYCVKYGFLGVIGC